MLLVFFKFPVATFLYHIFFSKSAKKYIDERELDKGSSDDKYPKSVPHLLISLLSFFPTSFSPFFSFFPSPFIFLFLSLILK